MITFKRVSGRCELISKIIELAFGCKWGNFRIN